jgi:hypothetical protein
MKHYKAIFEGYEEVTRESDPDDRWDRDDTTFVLTRIRVEPSDEPQANNVWGYDRVFDFSVPDDVTKVYLVYAEYGTGDTFGNDDGQIVAFEAFTEEFQADYLAERLRVATGFSLPNDHGDDYYIPWTGYFETLNEVRVAELSLF